MERRNWWTVMALLALTISTSACGDDRGSSGDAGAEKPSSTEAPPVPYRSTAFGIPLTVRVDRTLVDPTAAEDSKRLLVFDGVRKDENILFLRPAVVYGDDATAAPRRAPRTYRRYLRYLDSLIPPLQFTDKRRLTVDGRAATVMTAVSGQDLPGAIGCGARSDDPFKECGAFGVAHDRRLAVIDVGGVPLTGWARVPSGSGPRPPLFRAFDQMVTGLRFR